MRVHTFRTDGFPCAIASVIAGGVVGNYCTILMSLCTIKKMALPLPHSFCVTDMFYLNFQIDHEVLDEMHTEIPTSVDATRKYK